MRINFFTALFFTVSVMSVRNGYTQNMNSPYSIYGIGDIDHRMYNRTSGMGGAGLALRSNLYVIDNNPAGLAGLTRSFYIINAAATGKTVTYKGDPINADNSNNKDFWIKRLSFSVKINDVWASGIGFQQFSNVNYNLFGTKSIEGSNNKYLTYYEGDGGLTEYYWTNAASLGKHFSIGLRSSIIAGAINQSETVADASLSDQSITAKIQDYYGQARFQAGGIYTGKLGKKWDVSLGAKYIPQTKMIGERTLTVTEGTLSLLDDAFINNSKFYLPETYGAGLAIRYNNKTTFAADYTYEDWSSLNIRKQGWQMISNNKIAAGFEFSRTANMWNQQFEKRFFQVGGFFNTSYLQVRNEPIREYGITAGMGGVLGRNLLYTLSLEAGRRGTTQQKLIRENYGQLTLTLSYRDFLMSKGRKYD